MKAHHPRRGDATRVVHAGLPPPQQGEPFLPGPDFAAPFHLSGDPESARFVYGRYDTPTLARYEAALAELEGGPALAFASGMAAASAVLLVQLPPGAVLVAPSDGYPAVRALATDHLAERGVEVRLRPTTGDALGHALDGATLLWLETPSNPGLDVCDVRALARLAHDRGALVALDNSLATPLGQQPLALGADFSVAADTKGLTGHGDLILGHVAAADPDRARALRAWRTQTGGVPGPFETWLAHRSLATLDVRLERQCATAARLAGMLAARADLRDVRYPGLHSDAAHETAIRQMARFGSVLCFTLPDRGRAEAFLAGCELVADATSFGGVHSTAERRGRWGGDAVPEGFVRFSVGLEDPEDLLEDVRRALDAVR